MKVGRVVENHSINDLKIWASYRETIEADHFRLVGDRFFCFCFNVHLCSFILFRGEAHKQVEERDKERGQKEFQVVSTLSTRSPTCSSIL